MTYREAIQKLQLDLEHIYDSAGVLRDQASQSEKECWNEVRTNTRNASGSLQFLDRTITQHRAETDLKFDL